MSATYRLQLRGPGSAPDEAFTFADAAARVPYLAKLGITHLYLSPIMTAPANSTHGYDITDPTTINPELGGEAGFRELAATAREHGLKIIVDIVPNHVGVDTPALNPWWWDVLAHGRESRYAEYFDIDWSESNGADGRLGLPVLGEPGDEDKLEVTTDDDGNPILTYFEHRFPIAEGTNHGTPTEIHARQHYKLMYWRDGIINYRRFFSINGLAGVSQENPVVFEHTHRILNRLLAADLIDGVRVDHPDGLADPFGYLTQLRRVIGDERWLLIEKILGADEPLDPRLNVDGTTGYDALREFDGVFVNRPARAPLGQLAKECSGHNWAAKDFSAVERRLKADVARFELGAEITRLARAVRSDNWSTSGQHITDETLKETLITLISYMPVYRADYESLSRVTSSVIAALIHEKPEFAEALDLIATALISRGEAHTRFSQVCGAVMAKGVEDTAFYRGCRLVSLQEVGGDPGRFGLSPAEFHLLQAERARLWPKSMTTLTTHDTKRGEDVRSRITCITETADEFRDLVHAIAAETPSPDGGMCLFLLQNIIGVWPQPHATDDAATTDGDETAREDLVRRLHDYATKAMREAGKHTTWFDVDADYEASIHAWIDTVVTTHAAALDAYVSLIADGATTISLSKKLVQLLGPGIPDIYQGTEFYTDSLVDPDNRRPVDYDARDASLQRVSRGLISDVNDARMHLVTTALRVRQTYDLDEATYLPLSARGPQDRHLLGFQRGDNVLVLVTRRQISLNRGGGWADTTVVLPEGTWQDALGNTIFSGTVSVASMFDQRPYSILVRMNRS